MDNETQNDSVELELENNEAELDLDQEDTEEEKITLTKSEWEKLQQTQGSLKRQVKELRKQTEPKSSSQKQGEILSNSDLNYLDLKGVAEPEDVKVIENFMRSTGKTAREAFRDEYVTSKLAANKTAREVQEAMPSGTKRGGNTGNDLQAAIAKFEATGQLPTDFALKSEVVNAIVNKGRNNKPNWQL